MSLRNLLIYFFGLLLSLFSSVAVHAQTSKQDSASTARQTAMEQARMERQHSLDSMKKVRQHRTDSLAAVKKYRESKRYKDSVVKARETKLNTMKVARTAQLDSVKAARKRVMDSTLASRRTMTEQIRAVQKRRIDSMAAIKKYRESKRYQDSIVIVRKLKMDSVKAVRKIYSDSVTAARKRTNDSVAAARKATLDSTIAVRKKSMDSMKAVRKVRTDSLAKVKEARDKLKKVKQKEKEEKMQLALEVKIKKKQEAWSNEKMLKKKWSFPRQVIQNTFTRYNYYFNADRKMDEALENMLRVRKEDYDKQLALFPFDPDVDSSLLAPDMDSIIQKASVGIQIHDPRTKWGDDLYLLLGQAYYYKGDYNNAATSFRYIVSLRDKNQKKKTNNSRTTKTSSKGASIAQAENDGFLDFLKHRSAHNEALLWLSRTYTESHQEGNAESVIDLLEADPNMPQSLKGRLALEKAYIQLSQGNNKEAIHELDIVSKDKDLPDWTRMRAAFLNGQLLQQQGEYQKAAASFDQVLALNPKIDMDFYARKNMAQSRMMSGGDQEEALASLKKVLGDGKYAPYYEQIYYMMGRLAANSNNHKEAIGYLQKSISSPKSTRKQKALSFAALGNVYYDMHQYMWAKSSYDSAALFASAAGGDSMLTAALRRALVLGNVTGPLTTIHNNDSLLALASMSIKEQQNVVRRYIRKLEQQKSDSTFRAENAGLQNAQQQQGNTQGGAASAYTNWYFSNPTLMQQGYNEFKRKWGSRTLVDNWRRSAASGGVVNNTNAGTGGDDDENSGLDENGLPTEASLLAYIPTTAQKQNVLKARNMQAYMSMARAYINELEDFPQALATLDTLEKRYPSHPDKAEAVYLRYVVATKQGKMEEAKKHSAKLLKDYSDSKWAALVRPSEDGAGMVSVSSTTLANFYDEAYSLLMQRQYTDVLQRMQLAKKQYSDPTYKKRFQIMEAIALVGTGDYNKGEVMLTDFMSSHPSDSLRAWAEATLTYIKKNKPATPPPTPPAGSGFAPDTISGGKGAMRAAAEATIPTTTVVAPPTPSVPAAFTYKPNEEHYAIFAFPAMEQRAMGVKAAMNDFNTFKFTGQGLTSDLQMVNKQQGVVVTQKFKNAAQARLYMNSLKATAQVFREYKTGEYNIFIISASNYVKMMHDRDVQPYLKFYNANYK